MSSKKTTNLGLHAWEPQDAFLRQEFNENNQKVDEAVGQLQEAAAKAPVAAGTYTGTGTPGTHTEVNCGFEPSVVLITPLHMVSKNSYLPVTFTREKPITNGQYTLAEITPTGFSVYTHKPFGWDSPLPPHANDTEEYCYFAFR